MREGFEARLKEIDVEMGRFDKVRALALKNDNAIFKPFFTFYGSKCAASKDVKHRNCKKFYNSATLQFNF